MESSVSSDRFCLLDILFILGIHRLSLFIDEKLASVSNFYLRQLDGCCLSDFVSVIYIHMVYIVRHASCKDCDALQYS